MVKLRKKVALFLIVTLVFTLIGCSKKSKETNEDTTLIPTQAPTKEVLPTKEPTKKIDAPANRRDASYQRSQVNEKTPFVLSTKTLDGKFSPFFSTSGYDRDVYSITQMKLITNDYLGAYVANIDQPSVAYQYEMSVNEDNTQSTYKFWIKNGIFFSDGHELNADDVLFNFYVYLDPLYDGSSTMYSIPIHGLKAYQSQIPDEAIADAKNAEFAALAKEKVDAALAGTGDALVTTKLWDIVRECIKSDSEILIANEYLPEDFGLSGPEDYLETNHKSSIILFYIASSLGNQAISYQDGKYNFDPLTGLSADQMGEYTAEDYIDASLKVIQASMTPAEYDSTFGYEVVNDAYSYFALQEKVAFLEDNKGTVKSISGITKGKEICADGVERETVTVLVDGVDPTTIEKFSFEVAPMHYYAGQQLHDKANGVDHFGVEFSSLSFMKSLKEKNGLPVGCGPYKVTDVNGNENPTADGFYNNGICYFIANDNFILSKPQIKYVRYKTITSGSELDAVLTGEVHYSDPSASVERINLITSNSDYSDLDYILIDNLGYGYIGISGKLIPDINERRALMSAMDTSLTLNQYPGGLAAVIYRSMSQVSWAYPDGCTAYYPFDETGETTKQYLLKAGFMEQKDGTLLRPDGSKAIYTFTLPTETSDHPAGQVFLKAQEILAKLGIQVIIDVDDAVLSKLEEEIITVWAAAWQATIDPDMFQVYYSDPAVNQAGSPKSYGLYYLFENGTDEDKAILTKLNELIMQGRSSLNVDERKPVYEAALDKVMEIAVELPTYQRKNMYVYNKSVIDSTSLIPSSEISPYFGPLAYLWNVSLK